MMKAIFSAVQSDAATIRSPSPSRSSSSVTTTSSPLAKACRTSWIGSAIFFGSRFVRGSISRTLDPAPAPLRRAERAGRTSRRASCDGRIRREKVVDGSGVHRHGPSHKKTTSRHREETSCSFAEFPSDGIGRFRVAGGVAGSCICIQPPTSGRPAKLPSTSPTRPAARPIRSAVNTRAAREGTEGQADRREQARRFRHHRHRAR